MSLTFLSPYLLIGLSAGLVPIIIHLLYHRRAKPVLFSTLILLKESQQRVSAKLRLKELLLLLLRIIIFVMVATALARPLMRFSSTSWGTTTRNVVLVVDTSYSMDYGDPSPLQRSIEAGNLLLDSLKRGDTITLYSSKGREHSPPTGDFEAVREALRDLKLFYGSKTFLPPLLKRAEEELSSFNPATREVYILTDLQKLSWEGGPARLLSTKEGWQEDENIQSTIILGDMGYMDVSNTSIEEVRIKPKGEKIRFSVRTRNYSKEGKRLLLSLYREEEKLTQREVFLQPYSLNVVELEHLYPPGEHTGRIVLEDDPLKEDNIWYYRIEASSLPVLVLNGSPSPLPYMDETFYLIAALNPYHRRDFYIQVEELRELKGVELSSYSVIIFANVDMETVGEEEIEKLKDFLKSGGSLIIFAGDNVYPPVYNRLLYEEDKILPGEVLFVSNEEYREQPFHLSSIDYRRPLFEIFSSPEYGDLKKVNFYGCILLKEDPTSKVLASFSNGYPALLEKEFLNGSVYLFTSTCDTDWTDFPLHTTYLPFLHRLLGVVRGGEEKNYFVNDSLKFLLPKEFSHDSNYQIINPSGVTEEVKPIAGLISYPSTEVPGLYTLLKDGVKVCSFAVNAPRQESELERISQEDLKEKFKERDFFMFYSPSQILNTYRRAKGGVPLRVPLLLVALLALITEAILYNRSVLTPKQKEGIFLEERQRSASA